LNRFKQLETGAEQASAAQIAGTRINTGERPVFRLFKMGLTGLYLAADTGESDPEGKSFHAKKIGLWRYAIGLQGPLPGAYPPGFERVTGTPTLRPAMDPGG
jgi:hypothetical protein